jgi:hypothetical protein
MKRKYKNIPICGGNKKMMTSAAGGTKKEKITSNIAPPMTNLCQLSTKNHQETAICLRNRTLKRVKSVIIWLKNGSEWVFLPLKRPFQKKLSTDYIYLSICLFALFYVAY